MKATLSYLETHIVDHCNLRCEACCHFSNISEPSFAQLDEFSKDIKRLSEIFEINQIRLMGGEPLLHKQLYKFILVTRRYFPFSDIRIVTNGILLKKQEEIFWDTLKITNTKIDLSKYPIGDASFSDALDCIGKHLFNFYRDDNGGFCVYENALGGMWLASYFHLTLQTKENSNTSKVFKDCPYKRCTNLVHGHLTHCPTASYISKFNKYFSEDYPNEKGIDIYKSSADEILDYLNKPIQMCKFCITEKDIKIIPWKKSEKNKGEWFVDTADLSKCTSVSREKKSVCCPNPEGTIEQQVLWNVHFKLPKIGQAIKENIQASKIHPNVFRKYKNCNQGKTVVLCGAGPTLKYFSPLSKAKYLGLNRAFLYSEIKLDYLFASDWMGIKNYADEFKNYEGNNCKKFLAMPYTELERAIPENYACSFENERFVMESDFEQMRFHKYNIDIENQPFALSPTIATTAMQFLLYTMPKEIFIVGCDSANIGHFDKKEQNNNSDNTFEINLFNDIVKEWIELSKFIIHFYPNTKVYSVNPIGLKGIFSDVYTKNFLDKYPLVKIENLSEVKIGNELFYTEKK